MPFRLFGDVVKESINVFQIPVHSVETVNLRESPLPERKKKELLRSRLEAFEILGNGVIIIHFDQGAYVPDLNIPHISPVGGYDTATSRVTILDVDLAQDRPCSISFDSFYRGISKPYGFPMRLGGMSNGGYIYIRLR